MKFCIYSISFVILLIACNKESCEIVPREDFESISGKWAVYQESTVIIDGDPGGTRSSNYILTLNSDGTGSDNSQVYFIQRSLSWIFQTESDPERIGLRIDGTGNTLTTFEVYDVIERTTDYMRWEADLIYTDSYRVVRELTLNKI